METGKKNHQRKAGVILSYLSQAVSILSGLIYTPVMLRLLGQSEYGLYQLVNSVVSYLGLLSFGFSGSYMRFYSRYKAQNDKEEIARLNGIFMVIFVSISVICSLCGVIMVGNAGAIFGGGLTMSELKRAKVLMLLMVFNLALSFPNSVFDCCITAHEQFVFQRLMNIMKNLLNPFITLPFLIMGYGSVGMVLISTFLTLISFVVNIWFVLNRLKERFQFHGFRFALLKEMWLFTFFIFLNQIIDQINWSVDKFLLGRFAGTAAVALYGVGGQINSMYLQFSTSISGVFTPQVNKIVAESDDNKELTALFIKVGRIQFMVLALILSGFLFLGESFIRVWAGEEYRASYYVALLLIGPAAIPLIQNLGIEIQRAKNMHRARSVVYFILAVLNVLFSIPLVKMYGPVGAAAGTAVSVILGNGIFMNWYYHHKINLDIIAFWKSIAGFIPGLIAPVLVGIGCRLFIQPQSFFQIAAVAVVYSAVFVISVYKLGMNEYEKGLLLGMTVKRQKRK